MRRFAFALVLSFVAVPMFAQCGVERWSIKTGTDAGALSINLSTAISSTIYNFHQSAKPASLPANSRLSPRETNQYTLSGTLIKYVREGDSDYHLVIKDGAGRQMIIEIPAPNCVGAGSPFGTGISRARSQFDNRFTATTSFKTTSTPVTIKGIGFWDYLHGQTGAAPNGIEIHPVLNMTFGTSAALAPGVSAADTDELTVTLPADFVRDNDGGLVQVYRGGRAVSDDVLYHGGTVLENPTLDVIFVGESWSRDAVRPVMQLARELRTETLERYGLRSFGMRVSSTTIPSLGRSASDLDIQRALASAIESGRIQHLDENTIHVVMLEPNVDVSVGAVNDFVSYHSQFHPTDLAMRYVVVRGGLDPETQQEAVRASVARALVNPEGDGWY